MSQVLTWIVVVYFIIGLSITAFCVHMSYHEAAVGFGDDHDTKAQKVLESRIGPLGFIFLFTFWPLALLIAFMSGAKPSEAHGAPSTAPENAQQSAAAATPSAPATKH